MLQKMDKSRFHPVSDREIEDLVNKKDSKSTKSVISRSESLFRKFLSESNLNLKFNDYSKADLKLQA